MKINNGYQTRRQKKTLGEGHVSREINDPTTRDRI